MEVKKTMTLGIYANNTCKNTIIRKPEDNKLQVRISTNCAWCNKEHIFRLKEVSY
jgi:hypothetical protein